MGPVGSAGPHYEAIYSARPTNANLQTQVHTAPSTPCGHQKSRGIPFMSLVSWR